MVTCVDCLIPVTYENGSKDPAKQGGFRGLCMHCAAIRSRVGYNRRGIRQQGQRVRDDRANLKRYGLTLLAYEAMVKAAEGRCDCCGDQFTSGFREIHTDHDHVTGKVRGLLCRGCNLALGHAKEDIDRLTALIAYIRTHTTGAQP